MRLKFLPSEEGEAPECAYWDCVVTPSSCRHMPSLPGGLPAGEGAPGSFPGSLPGSSLQQDLPRGALSSMVPPHPCLPFSSLHNQLL